MKYNIKNEEGILIQGKGNYLLFEIKKGMLKTKKLLKIDRYIRWEEPSVQAAEVEEICIYQNLESGRHSIYIWK